MRDRPGNNTQSRSSGFGGPGSSSRPGGPFGFGGHRGPGGGIQMQGEKARDFKGTMRKFLKYIGAFKVQVITVMVFAAVSTGFMIAGPKIIGK
ncbi:MAG: hypothetical protein FJW68_09215, partial [Actinobacteria bacterium]|nr:hypothetical protein [Actinomycetota bacterium]